MFNVILGMLMSCLAGVIIARIDSKRNLKTMTKQAQNFINLCQMENNSISSVKRALGMLKPSVKQELKEHYGVDNDDALAAKIALE